MDPITHRELVEMVMVPTKIGSNWCYCIVIVPLILLLLWLILPMLSSAVPTRIGT